MSGKRCFSFSPGCSPVVSPEDVNKKRRGQPNRISSVRFTPLTWLPKSLWVQFHRAANVYFLVISVLVIMPDSPTMWSSTVLPFGVVLLWTALKDLYEDMRRRRDDDSENMRWCWRYDFQSRRFVRVRWCEVLCGDILLSLQDESFPADMAIVGAHQGQAYISTANLDGETNLKERRAADLCSALLEKTATDPDEAFTTCTVSQKSTDIGSVTLLAEALVETVLKQGLEACFEPPTVGPNELRGEMQLKTPGTEVQETLARLEVQQPSTLRSEHFVPRGCVLRNTPWLVSVVAYAGDDTQAWLTLAQVKAKISNLQVHLNRCVTGLVTVLLLFCIYAGIAAQLLNDEKKAIDFFKDFRKYLIILYQVVPVSLYVCFEIMKLLLGFQINVDKQMADPLTKELAMARTADLVEELGQVRHVFSDKTGTLTQNEMRFARCFIGGRDLGEFRPNVTLRGSKGTIRSHSLCNGSEDSMAAEIRGGRAMSPSSNPVPPPGVTEAQQILEDSEHTLCADTKRFFLCLAVCHDAQVECNDDGEPFYSGSSPDEVAFLYAAHWVGVTLHSRRAASGHASATTLVIDGPEGRQNLNVLCTIPFTSERKRMTVLCECGGEFICFTKGADSVTGPLCQPDALEGAGADHLGRYARLGLRTLIIAWKTVDAVTATAWRQRYEAARNSTDDRERKLRDSAAEMEHSFTFLGISAIEDRLQTGVPEAITSLKEMGILVWVLTGDKTETAVEIARSCELLADDSPLVTLVGATSAEDSKQMLKDAQARHSKGSALVLDGSFAKYALEDAASQRSLYGLAMASHACICCRLAPQQKRALVEMMRAHDPTRITLAIGDGANDVAMLQGAHVGVAVRGKEGQQAVQACDVAVSQFRFLVILLQCHGRRAYRRMAVFLVYYIYKHVVLAAGSVCWAHEKNFDGTISYPEWLSSAYSLLYTSLPVIVIVGLDCDVPDLVALCHPELYSEGLQRIHFNVPVFSLWMLRGAWHGTLAWMVPSLVLDAAGADFEEWGGVFWVCSVVAFSLVVVFVNLQLWMCALNPFALKTLSVLFLSFLAYVLTLIVLGHTPLGDVMQWQIVGVPLEMLQDGRASATLFLTPLAMLVDALIFFTFMFFRPTPLERLRWNRMDKLSRVTPDLALTAPEPAGAAVVQNGGQTKLEAKGLEAQGPKSAGQPQPTLTDDSLIVTSA